MYIDKLLKNIYTNNSMNEKMVASVIIGGFTIVAIQCIITMCCLLLDKKK